MPGALALSLILAGTVILVAVSWRSLRQPRSHGFFRFFAFEAILCIVVVNAPAWFVRPFAPLQLVSWGLLAISACLAIHSYHLLRDLGRPSTPEPGSSLFPIENTSALVTSGAFRLIRHPAYASLLYFAWGAALKSLSPLSTALGFVAFACLVATAKREEAENNDRFGQAYRDYMTRTKLFIPYVL